MSNPIDNLFVRITDQANLLDAHKKTLRGHLRYQDECLRFNANMTVNLNKLRQSLLDGSYKCSGYYNFRVFEPKERLIWAPKYPDKIVQHAINNILKDVYKPVYIQDTYACIEGRGSHAAVEKITKDLKCAKRNWGESAYIVKMDIKKFFYSIDRNLIKSLFRKKLKCKETLWLLDHLVDSSPENAGLPLGNLTSQLFANIYLNELDQYAKRVLKIKHWVRYSDDITTVAKNKFDAKNILNNVEIFLNDILHLELNKNKSKIFPISQGVNTIGFKIHPTHRLLRNDCKKKIKRKLKAIPNLLKTNKMTELKAGQMIGSWAGHAKHGCSYNFVKSLVDRYGIVSQNKQGNLCFPN